MKKNKGDIFLLIFFSIVLFCITVIFPILMLFCNKPLTAHAEDNPYGTPFRIESTAYCHGEITASGQSVREGIAAGKREWIGQTAILYADDGGETGELIGIYEILDTGGDSRIKDGKCIDIFMPEETDCRKWGRRNVWVQIVDAKG